jgi:hypothetical protein
LINIADFLDLVTRIVMALVALLALADFLRHRGRVRLDVVLMLASLGIPMLRQFFPDAVSDLRWVRTPSSMIVVAQPYLLLRLVEDFRPLPRSYIEAAIVGMVLSWVALAVYSPLPQSVTLIIILSWWKVMQPLPLFAGWSQPEVQPAGAWALPLADPAFLLSQYCSLASATWRRAPRSLQRLSGLSSLHWQR